MESSPSNEEQIDGLRVEIDSLDLQILSLLDKRFEVVKQIGQLKQESGAAIYRPDRERCILERLLGEARKLGLANLNKERIDSIFGEIFGVALNIEEPQRIAFLGPLGSFCHQAAEIKFGPLSSYIPVNNIPAIFDSLNNGAAKYGVLPLENNTNGMVGESIDNLARHSFKIVSEVVLDIHQSFASQASRLQDIHRIYSRDIAFGQCHDFINNYDLHEVEQVAVSSTARAAKLASQDKNSAAICSSIAAKLYGLPLLFKRIETAPNNQTRFVIISDFCNPRAPGHKTSVFVTIKDFERPGALFTLLKDFTEENINITKIDSRPLHEGSGFRSGFYLDFQGHREDPNVARIFAKRGEEIKWLGSYPLYEYPRG